METTRSERIKLGAFIPQWCYDHGYMDNGLMILPPMALITLGCIIWYHRAHNKELQEN